MGGCSGGPLLGDQSGKGARYRETGTRGSRAEKHGRPRVVPVLIKLSLVGGVIEHQFWVEFVFFFLLLLLLDKRSPSLLDPENVRMK